MFRGSLVAQLFILIILLGTTNLTNAQNTEKVWTLQECLDYALQNSISLKQSVLDIRQSAATLNQSKLSRYPNIGGSSSYNLGFGRATDPVNNISVPSNAQNGSLNLGGSMTIFNGFAIKNTIQMNEMGLELSELNQQAQKDQVLLDVLGAYLTVLLNAEDLNRAEAQIELSIANLDNSAKLVEGGVIPEGNLRELEAQLASDELVVIQAQNSLNIAYLVLALALQLESQDGMSIEIPNQDQIDAMLISEDWNTQDIFNYASKNLARYSSMDLAILMAEQNVLVAKSGHYPSLSINAGVGTSFFKPLQDSFNLFEIAPQFNNNFSESVGLSLNIPIFSNGINKLQVENAQIAVERQRVVNETELNFLRQTIEQAVADAKAAAASYTAALKLVSARSNAMDFAEKKFNAGSSTSFEFNNARNLMTTSQADLIRAKYNYLFARLTIDYYRGRPVTF
ncbi:MAG: outer membrane protein [Limisphaerales bacterium]|jgi:outer membrane protein